MIRLLTAALLFASFSVVAETEVPHTFQDGDVIDAEKFNEDFNALEAAIDANAAALPPTNCTTDQIIVHRNGAWVCSSPELVETFLTDFVYCPPDKKVTGGGCIFQALDDCETTLNRPSFDLSAWECQALPRVGGVCRVDRVYAICQ